MQLDNTSRYGRPNERTVDAGRRDNRRVDGTEWGSVDIVKITVRIGKICVVENVIEIRAHSEARSLSNLEFFQHVEI